MKILLIIILGLESVRDIKTKEVWIVLPGILMVAGFLYRWYEGKINGKETAYLALVVITAGLISKFTREALGMGDVWVIGSIMAVCGFWEGLESILFAFMLAAVYGGVLFIKKKSKDTQIPFLPFLFTGVLGGMWL